MEKINTEEIRAKYKELLCSNSGTLMSYKAYAEGDDTETSLKLLANKINEIIDVLNDCKPKTPAKWTPEDGEEYYYFGNYGEDHCVIWKDEIEDIFLLKTNNVFKTAKEAIEAYNKIMNS